ncbi:MAG: porin family protein [Reichenbachiella sp.]
MKQFVISLVTLLLIFSQYAYAESNPEPFKRGIIPYAGFMGKSPLYGIRGVMVYEHMGISLETGQVLGTYSTIYPILLGFDFSLGDTKHSIRPYATLGGGMLITVPQAAVDPETVTSVGLFFGAGVRYLVFKNLGIQFEFREFFTEVENASGLKRIIVFNNLMLGLVFPL